MQIAMHEIKPSAKFREHIFYRGSSTKGSAVKSSSRSTTHLSFRDIIKVSRYVSIDIRPVPSDNAGFLAVKPRPAVGQDFHTAVPGLAEQSLSSPRNLVRISAFHPPAPFPDRAGKVSLGAGRPVLSAKVERPLSVG